MGIGDIVKRIGAGISSVGKSAIQSLSPKPKEEEWQESPQRYSSSRPIPRMEEAAQSQPRWVRRPPQQRRISWEEYERAKAAQRTMQIASKEMRAERLARIKSAPIRAQATIERGYGGLKRYGTGQGYQLAGARTKSGRYGSFKAGRPKGSSGRYFIPGVGPVGVYQYRDWMKRQRAYDRAQRQQRMISPQQQLQQERYYPPQRYVPQQMPQYQPPQMPLQMPVQAPPSPLGRLNLWDSSVSMTGGDLNLITPGFGFGGGGDIGLFTPFGSFGNERRRL
jgi:hypothetical protein